MHDHLKRVKNKENCSEICLSGHELATCQKHPLTIDIFVSLVDSEDVLWPALTLLRKIDKNRNTSRWIEVSYSRCKN